MARFNPCKGRMRCLHLGGRCITCGRNQEEIMYTQQLVDQILGFIQAMEYENSDEFMEYLQKKIAKKLN